VDTRLIQALLYILLSFVLVALNGFFVAAEFAVVKVRRSRLEELAGKGVAAARISILCVDELDEYLSATQLGITLVSLGLGWIGQESFFRLFEFMFPQYITLDHQPIRYLAIGLSFLIITLMHVVLGELVPKNMAIERAEQVTLLVSRPLRWFYKFARPFIQIFTMLANFILQRLGFGGTDEAPLSEEELKIVMQDSHEDGVISESEAQIIARAFSFSDKLAPDIMVPADRIEFLSMSRPLEQNLEVTRREMYTRFPLARDGVDTIFGVVHMKDVWRNYAEGIDNQFFADISRPAIFVDPKTRQDRIMKIFKDKKSHLAVIKDMSAEKVLGLVTLEDITEELVGDIQDEYGN
jgi:CBS domain containing-hemolysin-like protein